MTINTIQHKVSWVPGHNVSSKSSSFQWRYNSKQCWNTSRWSHLLQQAIPNNQCGSGLHSHIVLGN